MLLPQTCTVLRATPAVTKRHGFAADDVWSSVATDVRCRIDFLERNRSREEQVREEFLGRNHGILFTEKDSGIRGRDIIVITDASGLFDDKQYDIEYVDPVLDSSSVHHLECSVSLRDNKIEVT